MKYIVKRASILVCISCIIMMMTSCSKKIESAVCTYSELDNGKLQVTGVTDFGKEQSELTIPSQIDGKEVESIAAGAFKDQANLKSVTIEEGVKEICENAFLNCYNLENISFPSSVKSIGTNAFKATLWEKKIYEEKDVLVVNDILIGVKDAKGKYTVPSGIKTIGAGVFYNNEDITELIVSDSVESIGIYACADMSALKSVQLPTGLMSLGYGAFSGCEQLEIKVPEGVEEVGGAAFMRVAKVIYSGSLDASQWGAIEVQKN